MKKMAMMVLAVVFVTIAQANNVNWATGTLFVPTAPTGAFGAQVTSGAAGYACVISFYLDNAGSVGAAIPGASVTGTTDNSISALRQLNGTTGTYNFAAGNTYWASVYITSTVNGSWYMQSKAVSFSISGVSAGSVNFTTSSALPAAWAPEPTSMALLALGAAAVGLRRRTRK